MESLLALLVDCRSKLLPPLDFKLIEEIIAEFEASVLFGGVEVDVEEVFFRVDGVVLL